EFWISSRACHGPTSAPLFPYTTLFRSPWEGRSVGGGPREGRSAAGRGAHHPQCCCSGTSSKAMCGSPPNDLRFCCGAAAVQPPRSEEHTSELQSLRQLVCRLLLEQIKD